MYNPFLRYMWILPIQYLTYIPTKFQFKSGIHCAAEQYSTYISICHLCSKLSALCSYTARTTALLRVIQRSIDDEFYFDGQTQIFIFANVAIIN